MNPTKHILNIHKKDRPLNILTFPTHERYQQGLSLTGHNFWLYRGKHIKGWETKYGELPDNHIILPENSIPVDVTFDLVLSQNKFGQFHVAYKLSKALNLPLISLEHTLPLKEWDEGTRKQLKQMAGDVNVFISEYSVNQWDYEDVRNVKVIHHMVDTDIFKPTYESRDLRFLSVVNDWINRDSVCGYSIWKRISEGLNTFVLGDTRGLSKPAGSLKELADAYAKSMFFINTSTVSPVPTSLLEAMSSGCICISTATCMIPEIIEHGVNGFLSNDEAKLKSFCLEVLSNPGYYKYIGENARKTVLEKFNKETFIKSWNEVFNSVL